mmetsp:Transcript_16396/g.35652  ORF Transcript_16396/g.35652 Transcript_16396/m.35652 type:complete len:249 (-) Transcript_16396:51-797(-)
MLEDRVRPVPGGNGNDKGGDEQFIHDDRRHLERRGSRRVLRRSANEHGRPGRDQGDGIRREQCGPSRGPRSGDRRRDGRPGDRLPGLSGGQDQGAHADRIVRRGIRMRPVRAANGGRVRPPDHRAGPDPVPRGACVHPLLLPVREARGVVPPRDRRPRRDGSPGGRGPRRGRLRGARPSRGRRQDDRPALGSRLAGGCPGGVRETGTQGILGGALSEGGPGGGESFRYVRGVRGPLAHAVAVDVEQLA